MVCSDHFADGLPTFENSDPTVNLGDELPMKKVRRQLVRHYSEPVQETVDVPLPPTSFPNILLEEPVDAHEEIVQCKKVNERVLSLEKELKSLQNVKEENSKLRKRTQTLSPQVISQKKKTKPFSHRQIRSDAKMKFYTGIQTIAIFYVIFNLIKPCLSSMIYWRRSKTVSPSKHSSHKKKFKQILPHKDQLFMVLMRLRLGLVNEDLSEHLYNLDQNVSITFWKDISYLATYRDVIKTALK